jgi:signal recognition particle subunit SRP19
VRAKAPFKAQDVGAVVSRSEGYFVLYPLYFDGRVTRARGRRVKGALAVRGPSGKAVFEAAKAAGLSPVLEDERHHPSSWFERTGRVLVPRDAAASKGDAIQRVAEKLGAIHATMAAKAAAPTHGKGKGKGKFAKRKGRRGRR